MKVIIAGSRSIHDRDRIFYHLDHICGRGIDISVVVSGGARGVDEIGECYALSRGIKCDQYKADWSKYGKSAGYIRNVEMSKNADALVAFWDGYSKGTKHMIDIAKNAGLKVVVFSQRKQFTTS